MLNISFDGKFIFCGDKVLSTQTNELVENVDTHFWLSFLKENSIFCFENNAGDFGKLNKLLREVSYALSDKMQRLNGYDFIYEFEKKFVPKLISESYESVNFVKNLSNAWDFIIEKYENFGFVNEQKDAASFDQWIQTKGKDFIESLRNKMFSTVGFGVQTFLSFTGWGNLAVTSAYGALLAYDIYMAIKGTPNSFNILFDIIGMIPGVSKVASKLFKAAPSSAKTASSVEEVVGEMVKTKQGGALFSILGKIGSLASKLIKWLGDGAAWLANKIGLTYIYNILKKLVSFLVETIKKINNASAKFSRDKAIIGSKWGSAENVGHALYKGGVEAGKVYGITKGIEYINNKIKNG